MAHNRSPIDLHMHTTVSDGTNTPEEILRCVKTAGIKIFSVTDHDAVKTGEIISELLTDGDPAFLTGVEFSCKDDQGKYHILGYGYKLHHAAMEEMVSRTHRLRMKKVLNRLEFLKTEFGFQFPEQEIQTLLSLDNPGKPHIGNLMVKYGYAETKEQAIKEFIDRIRFKNEYIRPEEAISAILAGGGIPVLAHPFYGSGDELILGADMDARLRRLVDFGLRGIEAFYSGFSEKLRRDAIALSEKFDLFITAGSDYHGKNKLVQLGDTGLNENTDFPEGLRRFLRVFDL
ncbi:MAG: hypothetical protein IKI29_01820 [Clostridia bacterium]|nr:hypothetical protein [Clostridia bacterium]